ncbi:MAG: hypothetical protein KKD39_05670, partial [Candidatus Altiarchaeota archaeon]|nr:hypothetical protein [Candidatus Altiarchaeota archaeon]
MKKGILVVLMVVFVMVGVYALLNILGNSTGDSSFSVRKTSKSTIGGVSYEITESESTKPIIGKVVVKEYSAGQNKFVLWVLEKEPGLYGFFNLRNNSRSFFSKTN